jgi:hypothetical protein
MKRHYACNLYGPFALRHRCDALNHPVGVRTHSHPPPSRCAISTMVLR